MLNQHYNSASPCDVSYKYTTNLENLLGVLYYKVKNC